MTETGHKTGCDCGCMGAGPMLTQFLKSLGPSEQVSQHFKNAQLEMMKGLRTFLDEQITARSGAKDSAATHGTRITVE
jgi:hypothetical protein